MVITAQTTPTTRAPDGPATEDRAASRASSTWSRSSRSPPWPSTARSRPTRTGSPARAAPPGVLWGGLTEVIVALAGIGSAVTLFPVIKRQNEGMALGFVAIRTLEAAMLFIGVVSLLTLVHLRQDLGSIPGADTASLVTTGASLVSTYKGAFLLGGTLMPCMSALLLGTLMYRSGLVPPDRRVSSSMAETRTFSSIRCCELDGRPWRS